MSDDRGSPLVPVTVLGAGNPLRGDDGIGPRVVKELCRSGLPAGVFAREAKGTLEDYWDALITSMHVVLVDAASGGSPPGSIYLFEPRDLREPDEGAVGHKDGFLCALTLATHLGSAPAVTIVGVEPREIGFSLELSPEIEARLPAVVGVVRELTGRLVRELTGASGLRGSCDAARSPEEEENRRESHQGHPHH